MKKFKKCVLVVCAVLIMTISLCACGKKNDEQPYTGEDVGIDSEWDFYESTVNGKTMTREDFNLVDEKDLPSFTCDGKTCKFSTNGKSHNGTVTEEDGQYNISYDDTSVTMTGVIEGNKLTLTNNKGSLILIFEAK